MSYLLDTGVLSELVKPRPNAKVVERVRSCREDDLFLCSLTIGEIQKGIAKLPRSRKKEDLQRWLEKDLLRRFERRILAIDTAVATAWGRAVAAGETQGRKIPVMDGLIACTALVHDLTVVTRNSEHMRMAGARLHDPWA